MIPDFNEFIRLFNLYSFEAAAQLEEEKGCCYTVAKYLTGNAEDGTKALNDAFNFCLACDFVINEETLDTRASAFEEEKNKKKVDDLLNRVY